ncbi:NAD(P)H-dependent oxidoreductase [Nisaea acidiphila]|uniref:NAD(P)H-dependent oxidoreductase n=1 Tax=Nisaea acidiphila TaxID=1862145 RepID=A0A9J7ASK2_9PROT|nr:NAD(P)H-dependent oxidoreductase [Nisaea acidiphila]UUX49324.1 NAD(P)H-dependent oxidoreductase [Nisaea acidiphila]
MSKAKILVFAGSAREASLNKKLASAGAAAVRRAGGDAALIDLNDYPAPIYHGDDEAEHGLPENILILKRMIAEHDGLMIATPEYNGFVPPLLVNTFSWVSRKSDKGGPEDVLKSKHVAIMAASPGRLGGVRVIPRLRDCLCELGCVPVQGFVTVPAAGSAFSADGDLADDTAQKGLDSLAARLVAAAG